MYPHLGAANTPYARSVQPNLLTIGAMPDLGLIFDSVMARNEFTPHPNKVSSVFFYWASLIIHDLFQTDHRDFNNSQTSSYLDLSTLYGDTQEDQDQIRTFKDGKLKPDCFSEKRLVGFPPGCGVLLVLLNRLVFDCPSAPSPPPPLPMFDCLQATTTILWSNSPSSMRTVVSRSPPTKCPVNQLRRLGRSTTMTSFRLEDSSLVACIL